MSTLTTVGKIDLSFANASGPDPKVTQVSKISLLSTSYPPYLVLSFKLHNLPFFHRSKYLRYLGPPIVLTQIIVVLPCTLARAWLTNIYETSRKGLKVGIKRTLGRHSLISEWI